MFSKTETLKRPSSILATAGFALATLSIAALATPALANHTADMDADGYISVAEGVPFYGGIQNSITTSGDASADSALALDRFPVANANGSYTYSRTLTLGDEEIANLANSHIVVHGIDIDGSGAYDGDKQSSIADGVPFEATVPAACGVMIADGEDEYEVDLDELNSSNVDGTVNVTIDGNEVLLTMNVTGASADLPHAQHIHIGGTNECPPNTVGVDQEDNEESEYGDRYEKFQAKFEARTEKFQNKFEAKRDKFQAKFEARQQKFQNKFEKRTERFSNWW